MIFESGSDSHVNPRIDEFSVESNSNLKTLGQMR